MRAVALHPGCDPTRLFDTVWATIIDLLGGPATATLLRRSLKRAALEHPTLATLLITREGFEYAYTLPGDWETGHCAAVSALRGLAHELTPLLREMTGPVIVQRLDADPLLSRCQIHFQELA